MEATLRAWIGDRYVDLIDVLRLVGENAWSWRLEDFEGTSRPGSDLDLLKLDARLRRGEYAHFAWPDLMTFAGDLLQMIEGRLVALQGGDSEPVLILDCIDSSEWDIAARDDQADALEAMRRVVAQWPTTG